jgi:toxin ParE1/3/4
MEQISWTKRSLKDLKAINDYISLDSTFYATRFISKLISRVEQLIDFSESGRIVPEKNVPEIRELIEGNYRIFYRIKKDKITILRIHNSARRINPK